MITQRILGAFDSRLRLASPLRKGMRKVFPDHWTFMFGEIALYSFLVLVLTGIFLALFFEPSTTETIYRGTYAPLQGESTSAAFASTVSLSFDVHAGLLMRQTHHWAALIFVGAIVLHLCRIFFTGAYRRPREINWVIGVTMLLLALLNGFTGYSMPDDQLSGTGLRIIYSVVLSIPIVGAHLAFLIFGGEFPTEQMIPRMFVAHVFLVPALLTALIGLHLLIIVRQKHSQFAGRGRTEHNVVGSRLWPSYTVRTLGLFTAVLAVMFGLGGLAQINPVWLYGPFSPGQVTNPAQPDYYVAWAEGALRLFPPADIYVFGHLMPSPLLPGAALGGIAFVLLYAWPFLEGRRTRDHTNHQLLDRPRDHPVRMAVGVYALAFFTLLVAAGGDDVLADWWQVPVRDVVWAFRIMVLVVPLLAAVVAFVLARALQRVDGGFLDLRSSDVRAALRRSGPETPHQTDGEGTLETWQDTDARWRWRYTEKNGADDTVRLVATKDYDSESAALSAARTAYPDAASPNPPAQHDTTTSAGQSGRRTLTVATVLVVVTWLVRTLARKNTFSGR